MAFTPKNLTERSDIVIDIADMGVDYGCGEANLPQSHKDVKGRIVYNNGSTNDQPGGNYQWTDSQGHGTIVAGIAAGNPLAGLNASGQPLAIDSAGVRSDGNNMKDTDAYGQFYYGLGIAPGARIGNTKIMNSIQVGSPGDWTTRAVTRRCNTPGAPCSATGPLCPALVQNYSNNYYTPTGDLAGLYTSVARELDISVRNADRATMVPLSVTVAAGNIGQDGNDPTSQFLPGGTAKNVITMGAAESFRQNIPACSGIKYTAGGFTVVSSISRRGTVDNRIKPDLLAPATLAFGPRYAAGGTYCGTAGISTMEGFPQYHGSSGTSFAAPVAAGAIALLRHFYTRNFGINPSPALYKAMLIAGARSITGGYDRYTSSTIPTWPSAQQGFGLLTVDPLFTSTNARAWREQTTPLQQSQSVFYTVTVTNPLQPVKIVVVWTDLEGTIQDPTTIAPRALKNDLDVTATLPDGKRFYGNYVSSTAPGYSQSPGGCGRPVCPSPADTRNNVEVIHVDPALFGNTANRTFSLRVIAANMASVNGVPASQDFALFVINGQLQ